MALFSHITREARFLGKQQHVVALLCVVFLLSAFAVWSGISESISQQQTIERLLEKDNTDRQDAINKHKGYGMTAYYSFHLTYSAPSEIAFAAMGQRDIYPWKHRIRMLALEGQIYETDADNPELSFLGRFDFAFLVSVLLPLFVILLLHDLRASEREAGRYDLLVATAKKQRNLWVSRAIVMCVALGLAVLIPFFVGAVVMQASLKAIGLFTLVVFAHMMFWAVLSVWFAGSKIAIKQSSAQVASMLLSVWLLVTVLVPVISDIAIDDMVHSPNGGEIVLTQREAVNDAWDIPHAETWNEFLKTHPQWANNTEMDTSSFEWKWYYAFQQVGDQKASELSQAYRDATEAKNALAGRFALISPPMLTQRLLASIAQTDTDAAIAYEQRIRDFHAELRQFYYPLLFNKTEYSRDKMTELPEFQPQS